MALLFVGDGPRDEAAVPRLVEGILEIEVRETFRPWARLHGGGSGYGRKLAFALGQARDLNAQGLVATIDRDHDHSGGRLGAVRKRRDDVRTVSPPFPTALGEASPHLEAWLLDDEVAVRTALRLDPDRVVPNVRNEKHPKSALEALHAASRRAGDRPLEVWADLARAVRPERCAHAQSTGFEEFVAEISLELGPLAGGTRRREPRP